jgi:hypothetical protein
LIYLWQGLSILSPLSKTSPFGFSLNARYPVPEMGIWIIALLASVMPSWFFYVVFGLVGAWYFFLFLFFFLIKVSFKAHQMNFDLPPFEFISTDLPLWFWEIPAGVSLGMHSKSILAALVQLIKLNSMSNLIKVGF